MIRRNIEAERIRRYLNKSELAVLLGISVGTLDDWIKKRKAIPADKLRILSQLFDCSADYLLKERI